MHAVSLWLGHTSLTTTARYLNADIGQLMPSTIDLVPPSRNFQDPGWQHSVKNNDLEESIVMGGPAVGRAESMPAHPDLASRELLVVELRKYIRNFAR